MTIMLALLVKERGPVRVRPGPAKVRSVSEEIGALMVAERYSKAPTELVILGLVPVNR